jgi:hypothetical protein
VRRYVNEEVRFQQLLRGWAVPSEPHRSLPVRARLEDIQSLSDAIWKADQQKRELEKGLRARQITQEKALAVLATARREAADWRISWRKRNSVSAGSRRLWWHCLTDVLAG